MKGFLIVGARPNFMKAAALYPPLNKHFDIDIVHTGQHYDTNMSGIFFKSFDMTASHKFDLTERGHARQTAEIMVKFEELCIGNRPDFVIVVGDVNSTLACALVAKKLNIIVIHVEAGLRSGDMTMPEEINRIAVDHISDYLFVTEPAAYECLMKEPDWNHNTYLVGDVMIDILKKHMDDIVNKKRNQASNYCISTIHREKNVNDAFILRRLLEFLVAASKNCEVIFPVHPNTLRFINDTGLNELLKPLSICDPMSYIDFLSYVNGARFVITDSGSLQTECNYLNVPCLVLRENTERKNAVNNGNCKLVGFNRQRFHNSMDDIFNNVWSSGYKLDIDDGKASDRIASILYNKLLRN